jgi:hypothetical protein
MPHPILITGEAGGQQGSTGRLIADLLLKEEFLFAPSYIGSMPGPMDF